MNLTDVLVILQLLGTIIVGGIGWAMKTVISNTLGPIQKDICVVKEEVKEIAEFLKEHKNEIHPHPNWEDTLNERFMSKNEAELHFKKIEEQFDWRSRNGNH